MVGLQKLKSSFYLKISSSFQQIYLHFVVVKDDVELDVSVRLQDKFVFHTVTKKNKKQQGQAGK